MLTSSTQSSSTFPNKIQTVVKVWQRTTGILRMSPTQNIQLGLRGIEKLGNIRKFYETTSDPDKEN